MNGVAIKAIVFDTFGTVMDWRKSIVADFRSFGERSGLDVDWEAFVDEWKTDDVAAGAPSPVDASVLRRQRVEIVVLRPDVHAIG